MRQENILLGRAIHLYRKAQGMTLEELAAKIYKSKSTMGKYEQGTISIELSVLVDLAKALGVRPQQLLVDIDVNDSSDDSVVRAGFYRYFYSYNGFNHRVMRGLMVIAEPENRNSPVSLFFDIPSFDSPESCRALYVGRQERYETLTKYLLQKQGGIESPQLCFNRPLDYMGKESGIFFGISSRTQTPVSLKCIISDTPLAEDEELIQQLHITAEDLRITKKVNQFMTEPMF